ncbi:Relaxase/Mobilisation nuclease domain-containing protein [Nitrosospira multiformis]|uniref:Relaxase/Mobilisation nuclease domain-containing protein n=1 Tax=Nitrosospira multiformis TaxID=1231 RepID=A0A1H8MNY7_9PROT|nr:TraI/MobA(P) family conjugative relaxase [Nitrosospira multiformis]SEO19161.1 Relaxase/Mobilisation nuclease domain-containing protein [Nitrosospira multiformis]
MIAKHIPMKSARRSSFRELVAYITHAKDKAVRIGEVRVTNCHQQEAQDAVLEVLATQLQNQRACSDKTYHLLISFPAGDSPSAEALRGIEDEVCNALGFGEHQRVSATHTDTDNLHIHVAINKIHPKTLAIHNPYCDYKALGAVCERLEHVHGLIHTNHQTIAPGARNRALDVEYLAGVESLLGWIQRECLEELRQAQSWGELHEHLRRNGLALQERGNGLVVSDQEGRTVKASSIARDLSKAQLEKRFGPFEAIDAQLQASRGQKGQVQKVEKVDRAYQPRPMARDSSTITLYQRYLAEQAGRRSARAQIRQELREQKHSLVSQAKDRARIKRGLIRELACDRFMKCMLYRQAGAALREDIGSIHARQRAAHEEKFSHARSLSWFDWLAECASMGDAQALATLRRRQRAALGRVNALLGKQEEVGQGRPLQGKKNSASHAGTRIDGASHAGIDGARIDSVTKQGTLIYTHGDRQGRSAIRDSGNRLEVSEAIRQDGLELALAMAVKRFGRSLRIEGDAAFRERVLSTAKALQLDIRFDGMRQAELKEGQGRAQGASTGEVRRKAPEAFGASGNVPTLGSAGTAAARRYIAEREMKRQKIPDIPRHVLGEMKPSLNMRYAGWRRVDGQFLLLAQTSADEIAVIPVEADVIARVSGLRRNDVITLDNGNESIRRRVQELGGLGGLGETKGMRR